MNSVVNEQAGKILVVGAEVVGFHVIYDGGTSIDFKATDREARAHARELEINGWLDVAIKPLAYASPQSTAELKALYEDASRYRYACSEGSRIAIDWSASKAEIDANLDRRIAEDTMGASTAQGRSQVTVAQQAAEQVTPSSNPFEGGTLAHDVWSRGYRGLCFTGHKGSQAEAWHIAGAKARQMKEDISPKSGPFFAEDFVRAGWFVREGVGFEATSSDDPRAVILYRNLDSFVRAEVVNDFLRVGSFVLEGAAWVATSSDDPRGTVLYRKHNKNTDTPLNQPEGLWQGGA